MKKILLTVSALACALTGLIAVACDKTEETEEVTYKFDTLCEGVSVQDITVNKGEEFSLPTPPSRGREWEFGGWYLSDNFSGSPVTSAVVAETGTTYYAKWVRLYKINLDLKGGTLEKTNGTAANADDLYLKAGESVTSYLAESVPVKSGYEFGKWLNGVPELSAGYKMPGNAITLSVEYKVGYTLDVYTQSLAYLYGEDTDEFEKESITLYEYATSSFTVTYKPDGFTRVSNMGVLSGEIKEDPAENHFEAYFNRNRYTVRLNPNVEGTAQQEVSNSFYYGEEYVLPYDLYSNTGYVFEGWSKSPVGENDYPIDYIDAVLYNKTGNSSEAEEVKYKVQSNATLYAYWNKGYSDLFGGGDTIFLMEGNNQDVYLLRGGKYFKGEFTSGNDFAFYVYNDPDEILLQGRILQNNQFCYASSNRASIDARYFTRKDGIDEDIRLKIGAYNNLTYSVRNGSKVLYEAFGTYSISDEGEFTAFFDSDEWYDKGEFTAHFDPDKGDLIGRTVHFMLVSFTNNSNTGFIIRNEEEYGFGTLQRLGVNGNSIGSIALPYYGLTLSGYGDAIYYNGSSPTQYLYYYDDENEAYALMNSQGSVQGYVRYMNVEGRIGYMFYTPSFDDEFKNEDETKNDTLTLDGIMTATYKVGTTTVAKGYYTLTSSYFGGYILTMTSGGKTYTFRLNRHLSGTISNLVLTYAFDVKPEGYLEYYYYGGKDSDGEDQFYYPLLVINDETESIESGRGTATLYASVSGVLTKAAVGTYALDKESGLYTFTVDSTVSGINYAGNMLNLSKISSFVFALDTSSTSSRIYYPYSQKDLSQAETLNTKEYEPSRQDQAGSKLLIVGGIAIFTERNSEVTCIGPFETVTWNGTPITVISSDRGYVYLEIKEGAEGEKGTFVKYDSTPYTAYLYREDGTRYRYETMAFDGKGGVTYSYRNGTDEDGKPITVSHTGTVSDTGATAGVSTIYLFTETGASGEPLTFRYILVSDSSYRYFSIISDKEGTFTSEDSGETLVLDGTGFNLTYSDTYGNIYRNVYRARTDTIVYTYINGEYLYFELNNTNKTFKLLGSEYGMYIVVNNQIATGMILEFDGKGEVKLSEIVSGEDDESTMKLIATSEYDIADDGIITITYTLEGMPKSDTLIGRLGTLEVGDYLYSTFFVHYDSIANTYVNEADYSVLVLDDAGSAIRYTQNGGVERGTYTLITDDYNILYYVNNSGTFATIYQYDSVMHLIINADNGRLAYFNGSFESLMFTEYGFAIFNGTKRYYYFNDGTDVAIYRVAKESDTDVNQYGFVKAVLEGGFKEEITIIYDSDGEVTNDEEGKEVEYFINTANNLQFKRTEANADKYPAPGGAFGKVSFTDLTFLPTGTAEFSVKGTVKATYVGAEEKLKETTYNCTVVRKLKEGTSDYETYFMVGLYRFDITLEYSPTAADCVYEVNRMRFYIEADSYTYLYNVQMYTMLLGSSAASMIPFFGHITIWSDYDEAGEEGEMFMSGEFGEAILLLDANGDTISFTAQPCEMNNGTFTVTVDYTEVDGYIYKGVFGIDTSSFSVPAYQMTAFYREQKLETADKEYEVTVGRIVTSENQNNYPGKLYTLALTDLRGEDPVKVEAAGIWRINGVWHIITRTYGEDKKIVSSVYYKIELNDGSTEGEETDRVLPYETVAVTEITDVETFYTEDGRSYVEINTVTDEVMFYVYRGISYYLATKTEHSVSEDGKTHTYIMTSTSGAMYEITITEDEEGNKTADVETYVAPEEEE